MTLENLLAKENCLVPRLCLPPPPCKFRSKRNWNVLGGRTTGKKKELYLSETHCRFYNQLPFCASWPRNKCFKKSIKGGRRADRELLFSRAVGLFAFFRLSLLLPKAAAAPQGAPAPGRAHGTARPSAALCAYFSSCRFFRGKSWQHRPTPRKIAAGRQH